MGVKHRKTSIKEARKKLTNEQIEEQLATADETAIALFELALEQEEINAAQDEALIELFEKIGG